MILKLVFPALHRENTKLASLARFLHFQRHARGYCLILRTPKACTTNTYWITIIGMMHWVKKIQKNRWIEVRLVNTRPIDLRNNVLGTTISLTLLMHALNQLQTMPRGRRCWRVQHKPTTVKGEWQTQGLVGGTRKFMAKMIKDIKEGVKSGAHRECRKAHKKIWAMVKMSDEQESGEGTECHETVRRARGRGWGDIE